MAKNPEAAVRERYPKDKRDNNLKALLTDPENAGRAILAWTVKGCVEWHRNGLQVPITVRQATATYKEKSNPLADFVADECVMNASAFTTVGDLRQAYDSWCSANGEKHILNLTVAGLPVILGLAFYFSERLLRQWLGGKLDRDIDVLNTIAGGEFYKTPSGSYLLSLHDAFPPEIRGDMLSLLHLTTELSVRAKSDLLFREVGLELAPDPELENQFKELKYLEKSIGPTGMLAIRPLLSQTPRDLWEMHQLAQG